MRQNATKRKILRQVITKAYKGNYKPYKVKCRTSYPVSTATARRRGQRGKRV